MTSSLPHCALLEDLSKTCGCTLPARCKWMGCWTPVFFFLCLRVRVCVCVFAQAAFFHYLVFLVFLSHSRLLTSCVVHLACSSRQLCVRSDAIEARRVGRGYRTRHNAGACVHTSVTPSDIESKNNRERHFLFNYLIQRERFDFYQICTEPRWLCSLVHRLQAELI